MHTWLLKVLEIYKIAPQHFISDWSTQVSLVDSSITFRKNNTLETGTIKIRKSIFQEDSIGPLKFCLELNRGNTQYKITHLLHLDDVKLYTSTPSHIYNLLHTIEVFSKYVRMGVHQSIGTEHRAMKIKIEKEYMTSLKTILSTKLKPMSTLLTLMYSPFWPIRQVLSKRRQQTSKT